MNVLVVVDDRRGWQINELFVLLLVAPLVVAVVAGYALFWLVRALWRLYAASAEARARQRAELLARADQQQAWVMAGDPRGTYGC